jgi:hypothetical protein
MAAASVSQRPAQIGLAVWMLYLAIGIAAFRVAIVAQRHMDVRSPDFLIRTTAVVAAICLFLIFRISKGSNWARWFLLAIFLLSIPLKFLAVIETFTTYPVQGGLDAAQFALALIGLGLLFHPNASKWFAKSGGSTRS